VFGKPLTNLAVIRSKLAAMISKVEAGQSWLETITYQMNNVGFRSIALYSHSPIAFQMNYAEQSDRLAGPIGLLKTYAARMPSDRNNANLFYP
jgi:hypothetical protein